MCLSALLSVAMNTDAMRSTSSPNWTPAAPWCGDPIKMMPYVESFIDRCSSNAPFRAASEWINACSGQLINFGSSFENTYDLQDNAS
jgi:hypothetical protein